MRELSTVKILARRKDLVYAGLFILSKAEGRPARRPFTLIGRTVKSFSLIFMPKTRDLTPLF
jgi:hypothetical protein